MRARRSVARGRLGVVRRAGRRPGFKPHKLVSQTAQASVTTETTI